MYRSGILQRLKVFSGQMRESCTHLRVTSLVPFHSARGEGETLTNFAWDCFAHSGFGLKAGLTASQRHLTVVNDGTRHTIWGMPGLVSQLQMC